MTTNTMAGVSHRKPGLEFHPRGRALSLALLAIGVDGSFCLFLDTMAGIEGPAQHLARLGPALVLALLFRAWMITSAPAPGAVPPIRFWGGLLGTWTLAYAAGLWAIASMPVTGSALVIGALGAVGALATGWSLAPALPGLLRGRSPEWLLGSGAATGLAGGLAFMLLPQWSQFQELSPVVRILSLNAVLLLPWTAAVMALVAQNSAAGAPGCQSGAFQ